MNNSGTRMALEYRLGLVLFMYSNDQAPKYSYITCTCHTSPVNEGGGAHIKVPPPHGPKWSYPRVLQS